MDWSTSVLPTNLNLHDGNDHTNDKQFSSTIFHLTKSVAESTKVDIAHQKGLQNLLIMMSTSEGDPMPRMKATDLRTELNSQISLHRDIEEIELTRNRSIIFRSKSAECQKQILKINYLGKKNVFTRVLNDTISVQYVIHDVDIDISLQEIGDELDYIGLNWFNLVRFTKTVEGKRVPIPTVLVKEFGKIVPDKIKMWYMRHHVSKYIEKPRVCFKCLKFGHVKNKCNGRITCSKCSGEHYVSNCISNDIICFRCQGSHLATDRKCPQYVMEVEILKVKSAKHVSYQQAKKYISEKQNTYAKALSVKVAESVNDKVLRCIEILSNKVECLTRLFFHKSDLKQDATKETPINYVPSMSENKFDENGMNKTVKNIQSERKLLKSEKVVCESQVKEIICSNSQNTSIQDNLELQQDVKNNDESLKCEKIRNENKVIEIKDSNCQNESVQEDFVKETSDSSYENISDILSCTDDSEEGTVRKRKRKNNRKSKNKANLVEMSLDVATREDAKK